MGLITSFRSSRGAALVEIIVSAVIIATCFVSVYVVAGFSLRASVTASEKVQAAYLFDGSIDGLKFLRDIGWDARIGSKQLGQPYCLDFGGGVNFSELGLTLASMPRMIQLRMDEASGTLTDSSGRNHPASVVGGVTYGQSGVAGTSALQFNGTNGYAQVTDHADFDMGSFTAEAWIKTANAGTGSRVIVTHQQWGGSGWRLALKDNILEFVLSTDTLSPSTKGVTLNDNKWHHVAVVRDIASLQKVAKWYVDGKLVGSQNISNTSTFSVPANVEIGAWFGGLVWQYSGLIDEVSVINRALTTQEIYEEYAAGSVCRKFDGKFVRTITFKNACRESESSTFNISTESTSGAPCSGTRVADPLTKLATFSVSGGSVNVSADTYLTKMFLCSYL